MNIDAENGLQQSGLQYLQSAVGHGNLRLNLHDLLCLLLITGLSLLGSGQLRLLLLQNLLGLLNLLLQLPDRIATTVHRIDAGTGRLTRSALSSPSLLWAAGASGLVSSACP